MITRATVFAIGVSALAFGCSAEMTLEQENEEIVDNLVQAGFPISDIQIFDGKVYTGRDAHVTLAASREMLELDGTSQEQYRTSALMSGKTKVCVNPSSAFNANATLSNALNMAIANYNNLPLVFDFARGPTTGCSANISITTTSGAGGSAGFPSGGSPYPGPVYIGTGTASYGVDVVEHVITHELGHCIGFRHSDYFNRAISCGSGGNEGSAGVGAIHVSGTPTGATVGGSIMNSCFRSSETGEFTSSDVTALNNIY